MITALVKGLQVLKKKKKTPKQTTEEYVTYVQLILTSYMAFSIRKLHSFATVRCDIKATEISSGLCSTPLRRQEQESCDALRPLLVHNACSSLWNGSE
jgi:hypothetical protein